MRPLKRAEYDRLVALGCFDDEKIELLNGMLVAVSPQGAGHAYVTTKLTALLIRALGERAIVQCQAPLGAWDDSEPEPDLAVVPNRDYSHDHPASALLVIEVAQSSLDKDRLVKATLYARAGVPEYWIVNLPERVVEVHRDPRPDGGYASVTIHGADQTIHPAAFPDVAVAIAEVLPRAAERISDR